VGAEQAEQAEQIVIVGAGLAGLRTVEELRAAGYQDAISLIGALITSRAEAQSASGPDAEIALLKQQLKLMEQKLDKLQKQTTANTAAARPYACSRRSAMPRSAI